MLAPYSNTADRILVSPCCSFEYSLLADVFHRAQNYVHYNVQDHRVLAGTVHFPGALYQTATHSLPPPAKCKYNVIGTKQCLRHYWNT